jgi:hypothetical protein
MKLFILSCLFFWINFFRRDLFPQSVNRARLERQKSFQAPEHYGDVVDKFTFDSRARCVLLD